MKNILAFTFLFCAVTLFSQNKTKVENVDVATFKKYIDEKKGELIDLRTTDELKSKGKIKNAKQIDFLAKDAEEQISKLDHNKTYLIYCAGGGRSGDCAELMQKQGFLHVVNLEKGFGDWVKQGQPVEQVK
jgi:rhodanese-related sulfurtransferase